MRAKGDRLPPNPLLPVRPAGDVPVSAFLAPITVNLPQRLPREVRQVLAAQQHTALVHARKMEVVAGCAELALFSVASLSNVEYQLVQAVPHAQARLSGLVNMATAVMGGQLARLAREL